MITSRSGRIQNTATSVYRDVPTVTDKFDQIEITDDVFLTIENEMVNSFVLNSFFRLHMRCKKAGKKLIIKCSEPNKAIFRLVGLDKLGVELC